MVRNNHAKLPIPNLYYFIYFKIDFSFQTLFKNEIKIIRSIKHKRCVEFYEKYETKNEFIIVMENCEGGEILKRIRKVKKFNERDSAYIIN